MDPGIAKTLDFLSLLVQGSSSMLRTLKGVSEDISTEFDKTRSTASSTENASLSEVLEFYTSGGFEKIRTSFVENVAKNDMTPYKKMLNLVMPENMSNEAAAELLEKKRRLYEDLLRNGFPIEKS